MRFACSTSGLAGIIIGFFSFTAYAQQALPGLPPGVDEVFTGFTNATTAVVSAGLPLAKPGCGGGDSANPPIPKERPEGCRRVLPITAESQCYLGSLMKGMAAPFLRLNCSKVPFIAGIFKGYMADFAKGMTPHQMRDRISKIRPLLQGMKSMPPAQLAAESIAGDIGQMDSALGQVDRLIGEWESAVYVNDKYKKCTTGNEGVDKVTKTALGWDMAREVLYSNQISIQGQCGETPDAPNAMQIASRSPNDEKQDWVPEQAITMP